MDRLDAATLEEATVGAGLKLNTNAVRLIESVPALHSKVVLMTSDHPEMRRQIVLTLTAIGTSEADTTLRVILSEPSDAHLRDAAVSGLARRETAFLRQLLADLNWRDATPSRRAVITAIARSVVRREEAREMLELVNLIAEASSSDSQQKSWHQLALLDAIPAPQRDEYGTAKVIHVATKPAAVDQLNVPKVAALFQWPGKPMPPRPKVEPLTPAQEKLFEIGRVQFAAVCAACHQKDGIGQEGKAPPLVNSPWVLGPQSRLIRIVLHGMKGPITLGGKEFNGDMPSWQAMTDEQIAGVLTYVRREWGHEAPAIDVSTVHGIRDWTQARRDAWTEGELLELK
jgi:mono/diheme cytochrome c family protein